jgi:hypothetical protein
MKAGYKDRASMTTWKTDVAWLSADEPANPFPFPVLDCRPACAAFAQATDSVVESQSLGAIEALVRSSQPSLLPTDSLSANCSIKIRLNGGPSGLAGFTVAGQGDRWIFHVEGQTIVARRQWTGQTIHVAEFELDDDFLAVTHITSQRDFVYNSFDYAIAEMHFLLKIYLEGARAAFPIPPGLERTNNVKIATIGWKTHGDIAKFARVLEPASRS